MIKKILAGVLSAVLLIGCVAAQPVKAETDYTKSSLDKYLDTWKDMDDMELCEMLDSATSCGDLYRFFKKLTVEEHNQIVKKGDNILAYIYSYDDWSENWGYDWGKWDNWKELKEQPITVQCKKLSSDTIRIPYGSSTTIKATAAKGKISYSSGDTKIFTVSSKGKIVAKGCGKTTILIKASQKGNYKPGYKKITVIVEPKQEKITAAKSKKKSQLTVSWKKYSHATGYQVQYSTNNKFKGATKVNIKNNKTTTTTLKKLKAGKKYYVRVRAYKKLKGTTICGKWSNNKVVTIRKK